MRKAQQRVADLQASEKEAQQAVERAQAVHRAAQAATARAQQELQVAQQALDQLLRGVEDLARLDDLAVVDLTYGTDEENEGLGNAPRQIEQ